jgi:hypothetical protein
LEVAAEVLGFTTDSIIINDGLASSETTMEATAIDTGGQRAMEVVIVESH